MVGREQTQGRPRNMEADREIKEKAQNR